MQQLIVDWLGQAPSPRLERCQLSKRVAQGQLSGCAADIGRGACACLRADALVYSTRSDTPPDSSSQTGQLYCFEAKKLQHVWPNLCCLCRQS